MFAYSLGEHQQGSAISDLYESHHVAYKDQFQKDWKIFQGKNDWTIEDNKCNFKKSSQHTDTWTDVSPSKNLKAVNMNKN